MIGFGIAEAAPSQVEPFRLSVRSGAMRDAGMVTNLVWEVGTNWFVIAPINKWGAELNRGEQRLEFKASSSGTNQAAILVKYTATTNQLSAEELQTEALNRHPGFLVTRNGTTASGCGPAVVFDLLMTEEATRLRYAIPARRTAFVVMPDGVLECTLSTSLRSFDSLKQAFARFMVGIKLEPPEERVRGGSVDLLR